MESLLYLLKVSACMAVFYTFYHFFLQKLTFFSGNRYYLLSTLMLSFLIPTLALRVEQIRPAVDGIKAEVFNSSANLAKNAIDLSKPLPSASTGFWDYSWAQVLVIFYLTIATLVFLVFVCQLYGILKYGRKIDQMDGALKVVSKSEGFTNCSFFNYVFIDRQTLTEEEVVVVIQHESIHAAKYHTVDKLIMVVCRVVLWFNPIVYLYDKALEEVHEYEADQETSAIVGNISYANLLLNIAAKKSNVGLVHSFVKNPLKERMKMLFTNPSKNMKKLSYLPSLPAGLGLIWLFGVQVVYAEVSVSLKPVSELVVVKAGDRVKIEALKAGNGVSRSKTIAANGPIRNIEMHLLERGMQNDTLRLVGRLLGKHPEVTIDDQNYDEDVLTWISPKCIKSFSTGANSIVIKTRANKVERASKIDIENAKISIAQEGNKKFFIRYPQKEEDGKHYEIAKVQFGGTMGTSTIPKGGSVLILINGKKYSESEAELFMSNTTEKYQNLSVSSGASIAASDPEYAKYDAVFRISSSEEKPF